MNLPSFDQSKKKIQSLEGEAVRLSNSLRSSSASSFINSDGKRVDILAKTDGFDVETCDFKTLVIWDRKKLHTKAGNVNCKKHPSLTVFVHRIMAVRFPTEYAEYKRKTEFNQNLKVEAGFIESHAKNDVAWLGLCSLQNNVRYDGSLIMDNSRLRMKKDGSWRVENK